MPRAIQSTFFEPLIHGLDVMLAKAERAMAWERANPDLDTVALSHRRDLVNLPGIAEQVAAQYEDGAEARSVHLFVDVAPDALVIGDSSDLHQIVHQLVASALEKTPIGGCVAISGAVSHGVVTLNFCSYNLDTPTKERPQSPNGSCAVGRGQSSPALSFRLTHIERILRAHGGRIEISAQPGHGSRVFVRLPVAQSAMKI